MEQIFPSQHVLSIYYHYYTLSGTYYCSKLSSGNDRRVVHFFKKNNFARVKVIFDILEIQIYIHPAEKQWNLIPSPDCMLGDLNHNLNTALPSSYLLYLSCFFYFFHNSSLIQFRLLTGITGVTVTQNFVVICHH